MTPTTKPARSPIRSEGRTYGILLGCFALSGATGIVYEVLWSRTLSLVFGSTTLATGVTLAVFMGGLALGSLLAGRRVDRLPRPLRTYALLEVGVGLCALAMPVAMGPLTPVAQFVWRATHGSIAATLGLRLFVASAVLLVPTALMGATLPVLTRVCVDRSETLGRRIGTLYGINTFGAAVGASLAGFVLPARLGVSGAIWAAALVNLMLAVTVFLLDRTSIATEPPVPAPTPKPGKSNDRHGRTPPTSEVTGAPPEELALARRLLPIAFALSGLIALVDEAAWTRALLMLIGSSVQAFAAMLTLFLAGLPLGAFLAARFADRFRSPFTAFAWIEAGAGVATWMGHHTFGSLPWTDLTLIDMPVTQARFLMAAEVMLPTALCLGALLPLAARACTPSVAHIGRQVGDLYAGNTLGAIVGSLLASFLLLPRLGPETTLRMAMAGNLLLAILLLAAWLRQVVPDGLATPVAGDRGGPAFRRIQWGALGVCVVALLLPTSPDRWDMLLVTLAQTTRREAATYRSLYHQMPWVSEADFVQQMHQQEQLVFSADGRSSHVAVIRNEVNTSLLTNGHSDGSDNTDMPTQILLGALPMLLRGETLSKPHVAVLGWGTGVTAGVVQQLPLAALTGLELEPMVLRADALFRGVNHDSLREARTRVVLEDGRCVLLADPTTYDVIISEPSNVWQAGVCNLFTSDFFRICRSRLRAGGLFAQWIGYGSIPPEALRSVFAALRRVFPGVLLFKVDSHDAILIASQDAFRPEAARIRARMQAANPLLMADLARAKVSTLADLIARLAATSADLDRLIGTAEPNTDDNARLEFAIAAVGGLRSYERENGDLLQSVLPSDPAGAFDLMGLTARESADLRAQVQQARDRKQDD